MRAATTRQTTSARRPKGKFRHRGGYRLPEVEATTQEVFAVLGTGVYQGWNDPLAVQQGTLSVAGRFEHHDHLYKFDHAVAVRAQEEFHLIGVGAAAAAPSCGGAVCRSRGRWLCSGATTPTARSALASTTPLPTKKA